jgi:hypothetical protein
MTAAIDRMLATKDGVRRSEMNGFGPDDIADLAARAANPFDPNRFRALNTLAAVALNDQATAAVLSPAVDLILAGPDLDILTRAAWVGRSRSAQVVARDVRHRNPSDSPPRGGRQLPARLLRASRDVPRRWRRFDSRKR